MPHVCYTGYLTNIFNSFTYLFSLRLRPPRRLVGSEVERALRMRNQVNASKTVLGKPLPLRLRPSQKAKDRSDYKYITSNLEIFLAIGVNVFVVPVNSDFYCLAHSFLAIKQTKIVLHTPDFAHGNFSICPNIC